MQTAIFFDCEFLVTEDARRRFWCGPYDPDPVIVQIGAVKIALTDKFQIVDTLNIFIQPFDRNGVPYELDPFFTKLTGISQDVVDSEGVALSEANKQIFDFAGESKLWSWGKDELNMMATSCYIAGIEPSLPATRFDNACRLLLAAGMPYEDIKRTPSSGLVSYFGIEHPPLRGHDALDDALSIAYVVQHLMSEKRLSVSAFE